MNNINNKTNNIFIYSGKLTYNQDGDYILSSPIQTINISTILKKIYCWYSNQIDIRIMKGCKILYNEQDGRLLKKLDKYGLDSYHVNGLDLEDVLFHSVGLDIDIEIYNSALDEIEGLEVVVEQGDMIIDGTK